MAYCDQDDVEGIMAEADLIDLTTDDPTASEVDPSVLALAIDAADSLIDGYIGARYALPLPSVPRLISRISARLTRFELYTRRPGAVEEWLEKDRERQVDLLEQIKSGEVDLGLTEAGADVGAAQQSARRVRTSSTKPVFGRSNLESY